MQAVFKFELDKDESENIKAFCNSLDYCSIEQFVGWTQMFSKSNICYFYMLDGTDIKCYCQIHENFKFAEIVFGPACCDKEIMIDSINEIIRHYKERHFVHLSIQMYYKTGFDTEFIEYAINKSHKVTYKFDNLNTKSSIEINLESQQTDIFANLRENHKRNIKKALKLNLKVIPLEKQSDLKDFYEIISKMKEVRQLEMGIISLKQLNEINSYLVYNKKGQIILVKDDNDIVLGGVILVFQGVSVRYFFGASDPDKREVPILHLALYEAIKKSKIDNFKFFDFWGYNHFALEGDQVYNINHFKKGFGGYYIFFPKKMNISLIPNGYNIYRYLLFFKNIYKKISFN
jgi:lipid II:glycine glycyltransferase (peptidoglycan interpeptide bridge formation enzyme)